MTTATTTMPIATHVITPIRSAAMSQAIHTIARKTQAETFVFANTCLSPRAARKKMPNTKTVSRAAYHGGVIGTSMVECAIIDGKTPNPTCRF